MRLNRFLALAGIASRRGTEAFIRDGRVSVNGEVCTDFSTQIAPSDHVKVEGRPVRACEFVYILLNKPRNFLTTRADERSRRTIYELLPGKLPKLAHVGRLDKESEGLLLLTNDGELALRMTHPRFKLEKEYLVTLDREFQMGDVPKVLKGVYLAEGRAKFDAVFKLNPQQLRVILTQGIKRQVRRVFAALEYNVNRLQRTRIGTLTDKGLRPGDVRFLSREEVLSLKTVSAKVLKLARSGSASKVA
jgi:23S rRNA pseudouridine2605 synthase